MKQYFVKYLPVEGEIKNGNKFLSNEEIKICVNENGRSSCLVNGDKKVKLFLCSRDIQVGDKYKYIDETDNNSIHEGLANIIEVREDEVVFDNKTFLYKREVIKVIGKISPNTTWVKEGDEFDENQVEIVEEINYDGQVVQEEGIYIKGPCGHYH